MPYEHIWGRGGIALNIHDLGARQGLVAIAKLRPHFPEKDLLIILKKAGSARARCAQVREVSNSSGLKSRTVKPVASRYTDYAVPAASL
jgi:hypothetical protein